MQDFGWSLLGLGGLFLAFAVYHYFHARGDAKAAEAGEAATMFKIFSVSHGLRGIGSLIMGLVLVVGGIIVLSS
ncbi:MAG: hypothetical protein KY476_18935 [Planctomycetes bacterium]|nr:hypothetical protein [Planctomycetota bacterium]